MSIPSCSGHIRNKSCWIAAIHFLVFCVDSTYSVPDHDMMISPFGFSDGASKDCFSDETKAAIWPASVPILDGCHGQLLTPPWLRFHV
jgi:hypothetical protein